MTTHKDTRTLSPEIQQQLRLQIVQLRKSGKTNREVASTLGVSERHASMLWQRFLKNGTESLTSGIRGRRRGEHRKIGVQQTKSVRELLLKKPCDVGIHGELWTRYRLQQALKSHMKIQVSIRTLGSYLRKWEMIPQKTLDVKDITDKQIRSWLIGDFRNLEKRIELECGELQWFVEKMIGVTQRKTFETLQEPKPMLATLSKRGQIRFLVYQEEITPKLFRDFLCSLIADVDKKIFLLVKKIVCLYLNSETESWLEEHQDRIEVIYLPV